MMNEKNTGMSAEEFKALSRAVLPHLNTICQIAKDHGLGDTLATITISGDGYFHFTAHKDNAWSFSRLASGDKAEIRREYREAIEEMEA
ncbi:MAG: hypothetical protein LIO54_08345 [Oscillospiraceae bacterium]|nr:hypothetical protein [Oscillospiraceae bacterium]